MGLGLRGRGGVTTYRAPRDCPVCSSRLETTQLGCPTCGTGLSGHFAPCEFCGLDDAGETVRLDLAPQHEPPGSLDELLVGSVRGGKPRREGGIHGGCAG